MCKCACQVTVQVAAKIPSNAIANLVGSGGIILLKKTNVAHTVKRDPMMMITQPMVEDVKDAICQPNIRQFTIIMGLLDAPPPADSSNIYIVEKAICVDKTERDCHDCSGGYDKT